MEAIVLIVKFSQNREKQLDLIKIKKQTYLSPYWEDQRDPFLSKNKRWKELGHQMVLIKHNENKPSALCSQKHEMQNFPNIQRLIDSQRAFIKNLKLAWIK